MYDSTSCDVSDVNIAVLDGNIVLSLMASVLGNRANLLINIDCIFQLRSSLRYTESNKAKRGASSLASHFTNGCTLCLNSENCSKRVKGLARETKIMYI